MKSETRSAICVGSMATSACGRPIGPMRLIGLACRSSITYKLGSRVRWTVVR